MIGEECVITCSCVLANTWCQTCPPQFRLSKRWRTKRALPTTIPFITPLQGFWSITSEQRIESLGVSSSKFTFDADILNASAIRFQTLRRFLHIPHLKKIVIYERIRAPVQKYLAFGGARCLEAKEDINFEWLNLLRQMAAMKNMVQLRYFYRKGLYIYTFYCQLPLSRRGENF